MSTERIGFHMPPDLKQSVEKIKNKYHITYSDILRLYLEWLVNTGEVPIGLPGSISDSTRNAAKS